MANRVMAAKARKLRMQQRSRPRELSLDKRGPRPSQDVIREYQSRVRTLGYDEANEWFRGLDGTITNVGITNTPPGRVDIRERSAEILRRFNTPLFVEHLSNPSQRIRIYFNSRQDEIVIQQMDFLHRVARISRTFSCIDEAYVALKLDIVPWAHEKPFPSASDTPASVSNGS